MNCSQVMISSKLSYDDIKKISICNRFHGFMDFFPFNVLKVQMKENTSWNQNTKSFSRIFFRGGAQEGGLPAHSSRDDELTLDKDVLDNLGIESELSVRIKAMQSLAPEVRCRKLQDHAVEVLWIKIEDLAQGTEDQARRETWMFLEAVICGQFDQIDIMRAKFFQLIKGISTNSVNDIGTYMIYIYLFFRPMFYKNWN